MKYIYSTLLLVLMSHFSYSQSKFNQAIISFDYSPLKFEEDNGFYLSEKLFSIQLSTNLSNHLHFFLRLSRLNLSIEKNEISTNWPIGIGAAYIGNFGKSFGFKIPFSLIYSNFIRLNDYPHIEKKENLINLGLSPTIIYRLPWLNKNLNIQTGIFFNIPLISNSFKIKSKYQFLNSYPFLGIGYRIKGRN